MREHLESRWIMSWSRTANILTSNTYDEVDGRLTDQNPLIHDRLNRASAYSVCHDLQVTLDGPNVFLPQRFLVAWRSTFCSETRPSKTTFATSTSAQNGMRPCSTRFGPLFQQPNVRLSCVDNHSKYSSFFQRTAGPKIIPSYQQRSP